jgi:DNA-binding NtrC family response regulator
VKTDPSTKPGDILVIDDDAILRDLVTDWLEAAGYGVRKAVDCSCAVDQLRREAPALVISDCSCRGLRRRGDRRAEAGASKSR